MTGIERLLLASQHLQYEIWMLENCVQEYRARNCLYAKNAPTNEKSNCNALLESIALHARVLIDFFYKDASKYKEDVLAVHYFDASGIWTDKPRGVRPVKSDFLGQIKDWADFRLAHLSYKRIELVAPLAPFNWWKLDNILSEIADLMLLFVDHVPPDRIDTSLRDWCSQYRHRQLQEQQ